MLTALQRLQRKYDRLEDINNHSENICLLAKVFGTRNEQIFARRIRNERDRIGSLPTTLDDVDVRAWQYAITSKYIDQLFPPASPPPPAPRFLPYDMTGEISDAPGQEEI